MKLPDNILSNLQNGRGMTPIALILMALASIGGVLWGFSWAQQKPEPMVVDSAASVDDPPVTQPEATPQVTKTIRFKPAPKPRRPCYECGMG